MKIVSLVAVAMAAMASGAAAQTPAGATAPSPSPSLTSTPTPAAAPAPGAPSSLNPSTAAGDGLHLAADTRVSIELVDAVSSKDSVRGATFAIRLSSPIRVDGHIVAPKGAKGMGEVVYAERGGGGGSPGKLVLAARYIDVADVRIKLKAFNLSAGGDSNFRELQVAAELLGPAVFLINGHDVVYPVGTRAHAKVAQEAVLAALPDAPPEDAMAPAATPAAPPADASPPAAGPVPAASGAPASTVAPPKESPK